MCKIQKKSKNLLVLFLSMVSLLAAGSERVCAGGDRPVSVTLRVYQTFSAAAGMDTGIGDIFSYRLSAENESNPMPDDMIGGDYNLTIAGDQSVEVGPITYRSDGIYRYQLEQAVENEPSGYTFDREIYTVSIHVKNLQIEGMTAQVIAVKSNGDKAALLRFENSWEDLSEKEEGEKAPPKSLGKTGKTASVKTGDALDASLWAAAAIAGAVLILSMKRVK